MNITEISIKRPTLVVVIFTVLAQLGTFSYTNLNYELLPKFSPPILTVSTLYPGASPTEVENSVTKELEDAISSLEGIDNITSTSQESFSLITVELTPSTDVDLALQEAQRKINAILSELPDDAETPALGKFSLDELPIMQIGATAQMPETEFYDLVENRIEPALARIEGVAQINLRGGEEREIKVHLIAPKMEAYQIGANEVVQAITNANLDFPTGKIKSEDDQTLIRLAGKFQDLDDLRGLVVKEVDGSPIRLETIAEIQDATKDTEIITRVDGKNSIGLVVQKQSDANAVAVSEDIRAELQNLEKTYNNEKLGFNIGQDSSTFTLEAADAVIFDLFLAIILVAIVMLLFLHSLRSAFFVMLSVPLSLVTAFIFMSVANFTLNLMTLLALSLVVGILVDDSIVVLENIYRHIEMGKNKIRASVDGIKEIGLTVFSITLVLVVVFLPIALVEGLISDLLRQFSLVVVATTLISLLVSFMVIPTLTSRFAESEHSEKENKGFFGKFFDGFERLIDRFGEGITSLLIWAFRHKAVTLIITAMLLVASVALVPAGFIGSEFVSAGDRGEFAINLELSKDATVEQTNLVTRQAEQILFEKSIVEGIFTTVGTTSGQQGGQPVAYKSEMNVKLVSYDKRDVGTDRFARETKLELERMLPGVKVEAAPVSLVGSANAAPLQVVVSGSDIDTVMHAAEKVLGLVKDIQGTIESKLSAEGGNPEVKVQVDRDKMSQLGLSLAQVGGTMQTAFSGNTDAQFRDGDIEYDINIKLDEFDRKNADDIRNLTFINSRGEVVSLQQFATIEQTTGPSQLQRENRISAVTVQSQVVGRPIGDIGAEVQEHIETLDLSDEVSIAFKGDLESQSEAFGSLGFALIASIVLVYLIMVALYDSYVYPFVVLFSIPVAIVGALLALALTQQTLNIFSILGIIMLVGLVAKNAILVVDFANQLKREGYRTVRALIMATQMRLRPILMTTIALVIGMLPIALASGAGAEWKNGLAWTIIGGLTSSMFLTLIIVPVAYLMVDTVLARFGLDKQEEIDLEQGKAVEKVPVGA